MKKNRKKKLIIFTIFACIIALYALLIGILSMNGESKLVTEANVETYQYYVNNNIDSLYLSDIDYIANQSFAGWDQIRYDQINDGSKISLKIENGIFQFKKGIWAHATSQITYDISEYNYRYFTAFVGINTNSTRGDGAKISVYTSEDGASWGEAKFEETKIPQQEASSIQIELNGAKYIRLVADRLANAAADYVVYGDAKLVNDISSTSAFKTVEEYNEIIESLYSNQNEITDELKFNLLKRELVKNTGQFTLNSFYNENEDNKEAVDWLMTNQKALNYYILGGKPLGNNYYKSLTEYSRLYRNYKNDFSDTTVTKYNTKLGDLYLRMATALSLTHSTKVGLWMNNASTPDSQSDSVRRYAIIKYMHKNNLFQAGGMDYNSWFENYTVEEMRYVMANNIDDQSMLWLNSYVRELIEKEGGARLWPHRYVSYVWPNYANPVYYAEENKEYFNDLFSVRDPKDESSGERVGLWDVVYTIPGGVDEPEYNLQIPRGTADNKIYKVWMNMRNKFGTGAVCGGISKVGANIRGVLGLPDAVVGQPGHAAHINYFQNSNGDGFWGIDNDVSGWAYTGTSILLGWASGPYASGYTGTYIPLAQEVINHEDTYEQSQMYVYLADSYTDLVQKETAYRKALEIQPLNLNAWYGLITTYKASDNKTEEQYIELAKEIAENLKYYPLPMYQMTNQIKTELTSIGANYEFTLLQTRILNEAKNLPSNSTAVLQPGITKLMGNFLLGQMDTSIATFSFDGEDAGKIVLSSRFDGNGVRWDYAINGKGENGTWDVSDFKEVSFSAEEEHKLQLTPEEIASITSENDIYIHIVGVNYSEDNVYKIDINESAGLPSTLFASDLENKLLGAVDAIEWKYNESDEWKRYGAEQPNLTGDKTIILRMGATGTYLASNTNSTYTFTEDVINNERKYIPIEHISLVEASSEAANQQGSAAFALDANYNTRWHSAWNGSDTRRFITVKLDSPRNISAVEYVPAGGGNGKIYDGTIWGSMDGENWIVLTQEQGLTYTNQTNTVAEAMDNIKSFEIDSIQKVQYVKIVADRTNGNWITARAFNFYENTTIKIVANFSFDGNEAGKINLLDPEYNNNWRYSLDGGNNWTSTSGSSRQLTDAEISQITSENGIKLMLAEDDTIYSIKIKEADELVLNPYVNDLENRLIGLTDVSNLEWKYSDTNSWTSYSSEDPIVKGTKTLQVRTKAIGLTLPSAPVEFAFTDDNQPDTAKYIPIKHLTIHSYSSQSTDAKRPYYAPNVIDGNPNTEWHTNFKVSIATTGAHIAIKLDAPRYISGIDYLHMDSTREPYGFMKNGKVSVSEDGENWTQVATFQDVAQDDTLKHLQFEKSVYAQYVKLEIESHDNVFAAASMINLYEDITNLPAPTAEIEYSTTETTNQDVTARLVNSSTEIEITNNDGSDTYTFTENGEFTFTFRDKNGIEGEATAKVDWIIKTLPVITIEYSTENPTKDNVTASISFDRDKTRIVDSEGNTIKTLALGEKYTVTFTENGTKEIDFVGPYGNASKATLNVDWIDREVPIGEITYSTTNSTNQDVVATLTANEDITITNNNGSNTYTFTDNNTFTFEFVDKAGNTATATAEVTWIDRNIAMPTITYSTDKPTRENVTADITFDKDNVAILDNQGNTIKTLALGEKYSIEFTNNATINVKFRGPAGNEGVAVAKVDWIDRKVPEATISYDFTDVTNEDVTATIEFDEENVTITNNDGKNTYTFTENGEFTFEFVDAAGNKGTIPAIVRIIDKELPTAEIRYSTTDLTNEDVIAYLVNASEEITIVNNDGLLTYTFEENDEFEFIIQDRAGNRNTIKATVSNIDKVVPTAEIEYSTKDLTNSDVTAKLVNASEEITIVNNDGKDTYIFGENGEFEFEIRDAAGNTSKVKAEVSNIDKVAPTANIKYSTTRPTNKDVVVTLVDESEEITITNNGGSKSYTFTENGEFTFEFVDKAGNTGTAKAVVNNINKDIANATITYSKNELTNEDVTATVTFDKEEITITNNEGNNTHTFTENGIFIFEYTDKSGNNGVATAEVTWIDKVLPTAEVEYSTTEATNENVIATLTLSEEATIANNNLEYTKNEDGTYNVVFSENGKYIIKLLDKAGNCGQVVIEINWIDKEVPTAEIEYSTKELTNSDVTAKLVNASEEITIVNNEGKDTYIFTENGAFEFEIRDAAGNTSKVKAEVSNIDKVAPTAEVTYSTVEETTDNVTATLTNISEEITITNNDGSNTYTFTKNGSFVFEFVDKAGNRGTVEAKVTNIIKEEIEATISYSKNELTNEDVIATITFNKEDVTITNNNSKNTYTFTENGKFTFEYISKTGVTGTATAEVTWIDKVLPTAEVKYSTTEATNENVIATLTLSEEATIVNNNLEYTKNEDGTYNVVFSENGKYIIKLLDKAGNCGQVVIEINWIDKEAPSAEIEYSTKELTNGDVIATLVNPSEKITIINNEGKDTYTFTENGTFEFEIRDEAGNTSKIEVTVTNIDKILPTASVEYSTLSDTNENVTVKLVNASEEITIINNGGSDTYTFTENGTFEFEIKDNAGNINKIKVEVTNIDKKAPSAEIEYSTKELTNSDVTVRLVNASEEITIINNGGSDTYTFAENGAFEFEIKDQVGNISKIKAEVTNIDKEAPSAEIEYSTKDLTNGNVIAKLVNPSESITIINNKGSNTYIFTENGTFEFEIRDAAGNTNKILASVSNINKDMIIANISYSKSELTNEDVIATITFNKEDVTITNNDGKNTYTFTDNNEFTFEYTDKAGNTGKSTATVTWIDKVKPNGNITYSTTDLTNGDVIATLTTDEEVTITNNNGSNTYVFNENGKFTFEFVDKAGNTNTVEAEVTWINKTPPVGNITYESNMLTNQNVIANLEIGEGVIITNNEGSNTYVFTDNGLFTFEFVDAYGNTGSATAKVDWIDKVLPIAEVTYSTKEPTNNKVIATLANASEEITIINNGGLDTYVFEENGTFEFEIQDKAGNINKIKAEVTNIDKVAPSVEIEYSTKETTDKAVTATIVPNEDIIVINNDGSLVYVFNENGEFTFEFKDRAGNTGSITAKVDWIKKESGKPEEPSKPVKPEEPVKPTNPSGNTTDNSNKNNGNTNTNKEDKPVVNNKEDNNDNKDNNKEDNNANKDNNDNKDNNKEDNKPINNKEESTREDEEEKTSEHYYFNYIVAAIIGFISMILLLAGRKEIK